MGPFKNVCSEVVKQMEDRIKQKTASRLCSNGLFGCFFNEFWAVAERTTERCN